MLLTLVESYLQGYKIYYILLCHKINKQMTCMRDGEMTNNEYKVDDIGTFGKKYSTEFIKCIISETFRNAKSS